MLRAATTGGFDYRGADPYNKNWRVRHRLAIREVSRAINEQILTVAHQHWLAYVSHSSLKQDSWDNAKKQAHEILQSLQQVIIPWADTTENKPKKNTIEEKYGKLIKKYHDMVARKRAERDKQQQKENTEKPPENS